MAHTPLVDETSPLLGKVEEGASPAGELPPRPPATPAAARRERCREVVNWALTIRTKHSFLDFAPLLLRIITAVFSLISFAVIASDRHRYTHSYSYYNYSGRHRERVERNFRTTFEFHDHFYFSYLLSVNVITFVYAIATISLSFGRLARFSVSKAGLISIFVLDQILSYLLISASTSAATGLRVEGNQYCDYYCSKANASMAFSFLAFGVLAGTSLLSGIRAIRYT